MVKLAQNGHSTIKMLSQQQTPPADEGWQAVEEAEKEAEAKKRVPGVNLFADSNVPSSFRRLAFSPDGLLLFTPTGVYRPPSSSSSQRPQSAGGKAAPTVFCTHIFVRDHFDLPAVSLVGLEDPSVAVRCCPRLFKPMPKDKEGKDGPAGPSSSLFSAPYRIIFAVATITSLLLYDSQHAFPLAKLKGLHYAPINDAAWSADGRVLAVCSSDGYLTFVRFKIGALGEPLEEELVPEAVKLSQTARYGRPAPAATEQKERAEGEAEGEKDQAEEDRKRKLGEAEASPEKRAKVDNEEEEEV
jgi:chromatin assembly factor 1 subunit B